MFSLQTRLMMLVGAMFAIIYAVIVMIGTSSGYGNFYFYLIISLGMMFVQYMIGPKMIEWSMGLKYVTKEQQPGLFKMVEEMCRRGSIPMPRLAISPHQAPNAFAFGRGLKDGRVCVSEGLVRILSEEELRAVVGHELAHIKNRDVLFITMLSVIPMIMYRIAWSFMFSGNRNNRNGGGNTVLIGIAALLFYFVTNLLVLYGSRIREYYADKGSVELGNKPAALASALYKLVYGSAKMANTADMKEVEGMKAFFINDPSQARNEIKELKQLDMDRSGDIDHDELFRLRNKTINVSSGEKIMELMSTHPNMLKRIKHLSELTPVHA